MDTELTLKTNKDHQSDEEHDWGFGQILALLLLMVPLRDVWIALRNIKDNLHNRLEQSFRNVAEAETALSEVSKLLKQGVKMRPQFPGRFGHSLHLAAYGGSYELVKLLVEEQHVDAKAVGESLLSTPTYTLY